MGAGEFIRERGLARRCSGLRPKVWLCVGPGYVREDIKTLLLKEGAGLTGDVILNPSQLCLKLVSAARAAEAPGAPALSEDRVLSSLARQEVLRILLADNRISSRMPELKRLRRQGTFFKKLDRAVQGGRLAFAHPEEEAVHAQRIRERAGAESSLRLEVAALAQAYETWLEAMELWDPPLLLRRASAILAEGWPAGLARPEEIALFSAQKPESLEQQLWEGLARHVPLTVYGPASGPAAAADVAAERAWDWQRWHTLDDAAESLADLLSVEPDWSRHAILIPDTPAIRRSLRRALERRGIPLSDPRDPTRLRWDEGLKWALLPLELVSRNFEVTAVISWLKPQHEPVQEIYQRGIRNGLGSYAGGSLADVHSRLRELQQSLGGKRLCRELGEAHLTQLRTAVGTDPDRYWLVPFFEKTWEEFSADMGRVGLGERRAHSLYWLERLQARLDEATPPADRVRPSSGVTLFRLGQAPLETPPELWILGLPPQWLSGDGAGDYWYSEREREALTADFAVRSSIQVREERLAVLRAWVSGAESVRVLDAAYEWNGRERESVLPVLREIGAPIGIEAVEKGAHPRWVRSYSAIRPVAPLEVQLPALSPRVRPEIRATELDRYSRCGFQALGSSRWRLKELREPEAELWPDVRGNVLHRAVKILLEARRPDGTFGRRPAEALEEAWLLERPRGLLKGARIEQHAKARLVTVLETFCQKEREYLERAGTRIVSLEGPELRMRFGDFTLVGVPDRIDGNSEGLFVLDYKTSSVLPKGADMIEQGYRLQLPFYAVAASQTLGQPALGVQFVELNRKGARASGIFFKRYNGKDPGKLTNTTARSRSLIDAEPATAWTTIGEHLAAHLDGYTQGRFAARPKSEKTECANCVFDDLCGKRRVLPPERPDGEASGE